MSDLDWIYPGAKVAEYSGHGMSDFVRFSTVERLTATQVVCASGNRYRLADLGRVGGNYGQLLISVDYERVARVIARGQLSKVRSGVDQACRDHRGGVAEVLAILAEIEQLIADARAVIINPANP